jgi:hypothetical protein
MEPFHPKERGCARVVSVVDIKSMWCLFMGDRIVQKYATMVAFRGFLSPSSGEVTTR